MGEMLSVKNINVFYGSIQALRDISFHVNEGEIVTLIGANGAGKTTTMHAISGLLKVQSGEIDEREIDAHVYRVLHEKQALGLID